MSDTTDPTTQNPMSPTVPPIPVVTDMDDVPPPPSGNPPQPVVSDAPPAEPVETPTQNFDLPPVISTTGKKNPKGRMVATILGFLVLIGGLGAGVILTQQEQNINEKAFGQPGSCQYEYTTRQTCEAAACTDGYNCRWDADENLCKKGPECTVEDTSNICSGNNVARECAGKQVGYRYTSGVSGELCEYECVPNPAEGGLPNCGISKHQSTCQVINQDSGTSSATCSCSGSTCSVTANRKCAATTVINAQGQPVAVPAAEGCSVYHLACNDKDQQTCVVSNADETIAAGAQSSSFRKNCGIEQIDIECTNPALHYNSVSRRYATDCDEPNPSDTPSTEISAQCLNVKAYNAQGQKLSVAQLSQLQPGDTVRFSVAGTTTGGGSFTKARFTINGAQRPEVTQKISGTDEFFDTYTIPAGVTSFTVSAKIFHSSLGYF